jgi:limonene-1,2-epoxide hydrolase
VKPRLSRTRAVKEKEASMDADRIVRDFCAAWGRGDLDAIMGAFAEGAVYHNMPMAPAEGKDAIRATIEGFLKMSPSGVDFEIKSQIASGRTVFNERVDTFVIEGKTVAAPVAGVFELDEAGKIAAWRDYFDMGAFQAG